MSDPASSPQVRHLAIIMDGNGRWAERRALPRVAGHRAGADAVLEAVKGARAFGIEYLTLYAFSTENWKRSASEVSALMNLLQEFMTVKLPDMMAENVRLNAIGRLEELPLAARMSLKHAMAATRNNTRGVLTLALNYGGRAELTDAAQRIARAVKAGELAPEALTEQVFGRYLYDPELPDPDLLIRTSGELRLSNFLLWELAYTEIYVTDVLWPDFDRREMQKALAAFGRRERRFGGRDSAAAASSPRKTTQQEQE